MPFKLFLFSDLHYSPNQSINTRNCSESLHKTDQIIDIINSCDLCIQLGDLINGTGNREKDFIALSEVKSKLDNLGFYHILGNHDAFALGKYQFSHSKSNIDYTYSFRFRDTDFIFLDANYTCDGKDYSPRHGDWRESFIPEYELEWLKSKLDNSNGAIVCCHQNLDDRPGDPHIIRNAADIRKLLEASGKVKYVFCGHYHPGYDSTISGIRYHTLPAMCEGNTIPYCIAEVSSFDNINIVDFCDKLNN